MDADELEALRDERESLARSVASFDGGLGPNTPPSTTKGLAYRQELRARLREIENEISDLEAKLDA